MSVSIVRSHAYTWQSHAFPIFEISWVLRQQNSTEKEGGGYFSNLGMILINDTLKNEF